MPVREHLSTILLAILLTLLIWFWAEGENRDSQTISARIRFYDPASEGRFFIRIEDPGDGGQLLREISGRLELEGPNLNLRRLRDTTFRIPLDDLEDGTRRTIELADAIAGLPSVVDFGISVNSSSPSRVTIVIDELETRPVLISTDLPGVVVDQITITPSQVDVTMSKTLWADAAGRFGEMIVFLEIDPVKLATIQPGQTFSAGNVRLRLADELTSEDTVSFAPRPVRIELTVQTNLLEREASVPVKWGIPPRDTGRYETDIVGDYELIPNVIISGEADAIARFEAREIKVFAMLHVSSDELEQGITRKRIEWMLPPGLQARMKDGGLPPEIPIRITPRKTSNNEGS